MTQQDICNGAMLNNQVDNSQLYFSCYTLIAFAQLILLTIYCLTPIFSLTKFSHIEFHPSKLNA